MLFKSVILNKNAIINIKMKTSIKKSSKNTVKFFKILPYKTSEDKQRILTQKLNKPILVLFQTGLH